MHCDIEGCRKRFKETKKLSLDLGEKRIAKHVFKKPIFVSFLVKK